MNALQASETNQLHLPVKIEHRPSIVALKAGFILKYFVFGVCKVIDMYKASFKGKG